MNGERRILEISFPQLFFFNNFYLGGYMVHRASNQGRKRRELEPDRPEPRKQQPFQSREYQNRGSRPSRWEQWTEEDEDLERKERSQTYGWNAPFRFETEEGEYGGRREHSRIYGNEGDFLDRRRIYQDEAAYLRDTGENLSDRGDDLWDRQERRRRIPEWDRGAWNQYGEDEIEDRWGRRLHGRSRFKESEDFERAAQRPSQRREDWYERQEEEHEVLSKARGIL